MFSGGGILFFASRWGATAPLRTQSDTNGIFILIGVQPFMASAL